jgi:dienelactone hydrolase
MIGIGWTDVAPDTGAAPTRDFLLRHEKGDVPGALWLPAAGAPKALILVGHGGSRHKRAPTTLTFVGAAVERYGFAVAAIDGPVHGTRRGDRSPDPADTQMDFRRLWEAPGNGIAGMLADWRAALTALQRDDALAGLPVGWFGLSMGTAYGLPLVAADERIAAAVLGMWGSNYPNSEPLVEAASRVACPVFWMHKTEDQLFTLDGALEIYAAFPGEDKRMLLSPGPHAEATAEQIEIALTFLTQRLAGG